MASQATLKPLLKQVVSNIFDPTKPELLDIEYKSTGFRDLLKSGFGSDAYSITVYKMRHSNISNLMQGSCYRE